MAVWAYWDPPGWTIRELSLMSQRLLSISVKSWAAVRAGERLGVARDYYGMLGISRGASDSEIKRAYRKLARELHPDVNPDEAAQARFKEISVAYEVLSDPEKRRIVDLGGDPLENVAAAGNGFGGFGGLGVVFQGFFGGGTTAPGPIRPVRPGPGSLPRIRLSPSGHCHRPCQQGSGRTPGG